MMFLGRKAASPHRLHHRDAQAHQFQLEQYVDPLPLVFMRMSGKRKNAHYVIISRIGGHLGKADTLS